MTEIKGSRPHRESERTISEKIIYAEEKNIPELQNTFRSIKNWITILTFLLIASIILNAFLYAVSIKQRTDILNLQDQLEEKNRIINQYKLKTNDKD